MDVLEAGLEHEKYVTSLIHDIYAAAYDVKDFRTMQFLDWFVKEQGEEETNANDMITKMAFVRLRSQEPLYAQPGAGGKGLYRTFSGALISGGKTMKYVCDVCGWEYDEELGYPEGGIAPGTKWEDVPEDFECPLCSVGKDQFSKA